MVAPTVLSAENRQCSVVGSKKHGKQHGITLDTAHIFYAVREQKNGYRQVGSFLSDFDAIDLEFDILTALEEPHFYYSSRVNCSGNCRKLLRW
jgi:hypothetical protein